MKAKVGHSEDEVEEFSPPKILPPQIDPGKQKHRHPRQL